MSSEPTSDTSDIVRTGILNEGNYSYMIATLQCLKHIEPLREYLLDIDAIQDSDSGQTQDKDVIRVVEEVHLFLMQLWFGHFCTLPFEDMRNAWKRYSEAKPEDSHAKSFASEGGMDIMVFIRDLLAKMHSVFKTVNKTGKKGPTELEHLLGKGRARTLTEDPVDSIVSDLFSFDRMSGTFCNTCNSFISFIDEPYNPYITVDFNNITQGIVDAISATWGSFYDTNGNITLEGLLAKLFMPSLSVYPEYMAVDCPICGSVTDTRTSPMLGEFPEVLIILVDRWTQVILPDGNAAAYKAPNPIVFPTHNLDLQDYPELPFTQTRTLYDLFGVIDETLVENESNTRYNAYAKMSDSQSDWYQFSDHIVRKANSDSYLSKDASVLFYRLKGSPTAPQPMELTEPLPKAPTEPPSMAPTELSSMPRFPLV